MNKEILKQISETRFEARKKWLAEHPEASGTAFGHAHGAIGTVEAAISEGATPEGQNAEEWYQLSLETVKKEYGIDVSKLPG